MRVCLICVLVSLLTIAMPVLAMTYQQDRDDMRSQGKKLMADGNHAEALAIYRQLSLETDNVDRDLSVDIRSVVECQNRLNRIAEADDFFADVIEAHPENWRVFHTLAALTQSGNVAPHGHLIAGEFKRGFHRGGGIRASSAERDRVRAIR